MEELNKAYDYQDIVNHILMEIYNETYTGQQINYLLLDEVQNCTPAMLLVLIKVTQQQICFFGDTAQTIPEGIGFFKGSIRDVFEFPI